MITLNGTDVEKYSKISEEANNILSSLKAKKEILHAINEELSNMEQEFNASIKQIEELSIATEKEVLRLESLTINDEPVINIPIEETSDKSQKTDNKNDNKKEKSKKTTPKKIVLKQASLGDISEQKG